MKPSATHAATRYVIGPANAFPPGTQAHMKVAGRGVAIFHVDGTFYALRDVCPHQGAQLSQGLVMDEVRAIRPGVFEPGPTGKVIKCPWHRWEFHLSTGRSCFDPDRERVRTFRTFVERGDVVAAMEYAGLEGEIDEDESYLVVEV